MPSPPPPPRSILEWIGVDIVGVMSPVSICMATVVLIVYSLSSPSSSAGPTQLRTAANLVYSESPSDSLSDKIEGSLLNAAVFVSLVAAVTFLLLLLYYLNFTSFLHNYMRFSSFFVLSAMGGSVFLSLLQHFSLPLDAPSSLLLLFNFSAVGVLSLFSPGFPILLRQSYMVSLAVFVAAWFTKLPEWTTWSLLVALAVYDLVAVLAPGGPLKLLVELASSRDEELPALVYEARPTLSDRAGILAGAVELQGLSRDGEDGNADEEEEEEEERSPLVGSDSAEEMEMSPLVEIGNGREEVSRRGIKLGLGDFVFYSVLVGRAAMYDLMTVYACYLAIISGLGCTLILLSVHHKALPALPISIALGVVFYLLTRLLMEPFVVGIATNLLMF